MSADARSLQVERRMKRRKPTRRDLLVVIGRLQHLIGLAECASGDDRSPHSRANTHGHLMAAHQLCIEARSQDEPIEDRFGPWGPDARDDRSYI